MDFLKQFSIITTVFLIGELLNKVISLPIPGSVWGMVLMFIFLCTGIIKLEKVEKCADSLLGIMALLFVPLGVGLMDNIGLVSDSIFQLGIIVLLSTIIVMGVTGMTVEFLLKIKERGDKNDR